jgi:hypothetical protein
MNSRIISGISLGLTSTNCVPRTQNESSTAKGVVYSVSHFIGRPEIAFPDVDHSSFRTDEGGAHVVIDQARICLIVGKTEQFRDFGDLFP